MFYLVYMKYYERNMLRMGENMKNSGEKVRKMSKIANNS